MKGYKAFHLTAIKSLYCSPQNTKTFFKVGEEKVINKPPKICATGFHFCEKLLDVKNYYSFRGNQVIAEVEALGEIDNNGGDKSCTNRILVKKILTGTEVMELIGAKLLKTKDKVQPHYKYLQKSGSRADLVLLEDYKNKIDLYNYYDADIYSKRIGSGNNRETIKFAVIKQSK